MKNFCAKIIIGFMKSFISLTHIKTQYLISLGVTQRMEAISLNFSLWIYFSNGNNHLFVTKNYLGSTHLKYFHEMYGVLISREKSNFQISCICCRTRNTLPSHRERLAWRSRADQPSSAGHRNSNPLKCTKKKISSFESLST